MLVHLEEHVAFYLTVTALRVCGCVSPFSCVLLSLVYVKKVVCIVRLNSSCSSRVFYLVFVGRVFLLFVYCFVFVFSIVCCEVCTLAQMLRVKWQFTFFLESVSVCMNIQCSGVWICLRNFTVRFYPGHFRWLSWLTPCRIRDHSLCCCPIEAELNKCQFCLNLFINLTVRHDDTLESWELFLNNPF